MRNNDFGQAFDEKRFAEILCLRTTEHIFD